MQKLSQTLLECALLTEETNEKIAEVLGRPIASIEEARRGFEPSKYGRLEKLEYIHGIKDRFDRSYKLWAFTNGIQFVQWKLGLAPAIDPVSSLQQLYADCIMKSRESIFLGNTSEEAKEAVKWTNLSIQLGKLLKSWTVDNNMATLDIQLALSGSTLADMPSLSDLT